MKAKKQTNEERHDDIVIYSSSSGPSFACKIVKLSSAYRPSFVTASTVRVCWRATTSSLSDNRTEELNGDTFVHVTRGRATARLLSIVAVSLFLFDDCFPLCFLLSFSLPIDRPHIGLFFMLVGRSAQPTNGDKAIIFPLSLLRCRFASEDERISTLELVPTRIESVRCSGTAK